MKFTIRTKLFAGFGGLLIFFLIFLYYDFQHERVMVNQLKEIYDHPLTVARAALAVNVGIVAMHRSMKDVVLISDIEKRGKTIALVDNMEKEVLTAIETVQERILGEKGQEMTTEFHRLFTGWKPIRSEVIALMRMGEREQAARITQEKGADYVEMLNGKIKDIIKYTNTRALMLSSKAHDGLLVRHQRLSVILVALSLIVFVLALSISLSLSKRIKKLANTVSEITGGNFSQSIKIKGSDEISQLGENFNIMTERLSALHRELESFSYSVSHDLRTPLRGIDGFSQALLEDYEEKLDGTGKEYLREIRSNARQMGDLIDSLLNLSLISRKEMEIEEVDLSAQARHIAEKLKKKQPERLAEFIIEEGITGRGDTELLRDLLGNLLENAWKFTSKSPHPRIELGTSQVEGQRVIYVKDNGAGFDMAYADKLFGAFQRLHSKTDFEGTGIGLANAQRIVSRHGGRIWAEGKAGQGAAFYFTIGNA